MDNATSQGVWPRWFDEAQVEKRPLEYILHWCYDIQIRRREMALRVNLDSGATNQYGPRVPRFANAIRCFRK